MSMRLAATIYEEVWPTSIVERERGRGSGSGSGSGNGNGNGKLEF